jgi:hypothetical protein
LKLHLGCGQRYLEGYVNIDFPSSEHSVQENSVADLHADLLGLCYPPESIQEVRLHHVFEHFPRPIACALLAAWHSWLQPGGVLHIEVPDFRRTALAMLNPLVSLHRLAVGERHLFGSHEAGWAVHCEGYSPRLLKAMLESYGFTTRTVRKNAWRGTYNFEIIAAKPLQAGTPADFEDVTRSFLANFLVDDTEQRLLEVWMEMYRGQVERSRARNA